jgi:hypothetical protein
MAVGKQKREEKGPNIPFKGILPVTQLSSIRPHFLKVPLPPNSTIQEAKLSLHT